MHRSMRALDVSMQKFQVRAGATYFDCLFSTRDTPFVLALTSRGLNPRFISFDVAIGYWIAEFFGDRYELLVEALKVDGQSGEKLIPKNFLTKLDAAIPCQAKVSNVPRPEEIIRLRADTEEADRPYFDTWIYWGRDSRNSPSHANSHKTLVALGPEALAHSRDMNASSKWSMEPTGRAWRGNRKNT